MNIAGFNKLTLLDFPDRMACIVFVGGCNMRCPFCHNSGIVTDGTSNHSVEEIMAYLNKRRGVLEGVVVSGGEPTIYSDLVPFIEGIKELGYCVKLDTNGSNPNVVRELIERKLIDYIAMDIKNSLPKYALTTGVNNYDTSVIEDSIEVIMNSGVEYEFRTTIVEQFHDENSMAEIGKLISGADKYFLQQYVDNDNTFDSNLSAHSPEKLQAMRDIVSKFVKKAEIRGI